MLRTLIANVLTTRHAVEAATLKASFLISWPSGQFDGLSSPPRYLAKPVASQLLQSTTQIPVWGTKS